MEDTNSEVVGSATAAVDTSLADALAAAQVDSGIAHVVDEVKIHPASSILTEMEDEIKALGAYSHSKLASFLDRIRAVL